MDKREMHIQSNFGEDPIGHCPVNGRVGSSPKFVKPRAMKTRFQVAQRVPGKITTN